MKTQHNISLLLLITFLLLFKIIEAQTNDFNRGIANQFRNDNNLPENFPSIIVTNRSNPTDGNYFLNSRLSNANFMICVDTMGTPVFYKEMNGLCGDLRVHPNGYLAQFENNRSSYIQYDSSYNEMRIYSAGGGLLTDSHDLLIEDDGSYWLIAKQIHIVDMSGIVSGGNPAAYVIENVILHQDTEDNILFQWNSLDHIDILDCDTLFVDLTGTYIDYIHVNALDLDSEGNLLISSRHLNEITKIDTASGNIIWRWGGTQNQFTFINDDIRFSGQHSIRSHENNKFTLFDNGNWHDPNHSRGLEYILDDNLMTATLVNEFTAGDSLSYSSSMGHVQRTSDQGTILGMAANNQGFVLSDFNSSGERVLDMMNFESSLFSYRATKAKWITNVFYFIEDTININYSFIKGIETTAFATIHNNTDETIELSGYHTNNPVFSVVDSFPVEVMAHSNKEFTISCAPVIGSYHTDALTIYSNSNSDSLRIASQVRLVASLTTLLDENKSNELRLKITPNPLTSRSLVSLNNNSTIDCVRITDIKGIIIQELNNVNMKSVILEKRGFPTGLLLIEVQSGNNVLTGKLMVN